MRGQGAPPGAAVTGGIGERCPSKPEALAACALSTGSPAIRVDTDAEGAGGFVQHHHQRRRADLLIRPGSPNIFFSPALSSAPFEDMPSLSSPFSALSALLLASSFLVPSVLSLPAARPLQPFRRAASAALAARDASSYLDNIIYIDANETNLYLAIEVQNQTYAAYLDSQW